MAVYDGLPSPAPHTETELVALLDLLTAPRPPIATVVVGHSRDAAACASAAAFVEAWCGIGREPALAMVDWPDSAASWLRAAHRFTAEEPDAWVVAAAPLAGPR
ncbi:hypothetical protein [Streptomyces sp. NPDC048611]|uniref:hypothetical protein n=1 Tax=Streptomyces sp. NPDC048611 TaxID=3155635 RepID=UPI0034163D39